MIESQKSQEGETETWSRVELFAKKLSVIINHVNRPSAKMLNNTLVNKKTVKTTCLKGIALHDSDLTGKR